MFSERPRLILAAVMMTALCLATIQLGSRPLWLDEATTFYRSQLPVLELVEDSARNKHSPLYFLMMKGWLTLGDSEFWMRFFSVLCFVLTVPVVYVIGCTLSGRRAGLYAASLTATAPFLIHHAQTARMYTMLTLFCSLALMSAALLISRQSDQPPPVIGAGLRRLWRGKAVRLSAIRTFVRDDDLLWLAYIVAVLGAMFTHNTAAVLPVVTMLIFLVAIAAAPRFRWLRLRNLVIANLVVLAVYAFWIPGLLSNAEGIKQWMGWPVPTTLLKVYANLYFPEVAVVLVALCALALWGWRRRPDWRWLGFILLGTAALPLMLLVVSAVFRPVFFNRTIIWTSIPFFVACAAGLARLPVGLRYLFLAGLLLVNLYAVVRDYSRDIYEPWDEMMEALAEVAADEAAVVLCPHLIVHPFNYYWRDDEREIAVFSRVSNEEAEPFLESAGGEVEGWQRVGERRDLAGLFDEYAELWMAVREDHIFHYCASTSFPGQGQLVSDRRFGHFLRLLGYARHAED